MKPLTQKINDRNVGAEVISASKMLTTALSLGAAVSKAKATVNNAHFKVIPIQHRDSRQWWLCSHSGITGYWQKIIIKRHISSSILNVSYQEAVNLLWSFNNVHCRSKHITHYCRNDQMLTSCVLQEASIHNLFRQKRSKSAKFFYLAKFYLSLHTVSLIAPYKGT